MPVEGQWSRVNNPLPARDRRVLAIAAVVVALAAIGGVVAAIVHSSSSHAGCISVTIPSTMGGAVQWHCGADAKTYCRDNPKLASVVAQCRRLGYATA